MEIMANNRVQLPQGGFSLVEFMIAIALGLLITGAVIGIFISGNRNYAEDERYSRLQENARFAMKTFTTDIASESFWGGMTDTNNLRTVFNAFDPGCSLSPVAGVAVVLDPNRNITNNTNNDVILADATASAIKAKYPCITDASDNTSVLVVKRVQGACYSGDPALVPPCTVGAPPANKGLMYLRSNGSAGTLLSDTAIGASPIGFRDWEYIPRIYYIRRFAVTDGDGIPTLVRKSLQNGAMVSQAVVEGVENFRITVGIASGAEQPRPVKVYILVRSLDRDMAYDTDRAGVKTFTLGNDDLGNPVCFGVTVSPAGGGCTQLSTADGLSKHYYRRVFSTVIAARNAPLFQ